MTVGVLICYAKGRKAASSKTNKKASVDSRPLAEEELVLERAIDEQKRVYNELYSTVETRRSRSVALIGALFAVFTFANVLPGGFGDVVNRVCSDDPTSVAVCIELEGYRNMMIALYVGSIVSYAVSAVMFVIILWNYKWVAPPEEDAGKIAKLREKLKRDPDKASYVRYLRYVSTRYTECWKRNSRMNRLRSIFMLIGLISLIVGSIYINSHKAFGKMRGYMVRRDEISL